MGGACCRARSRLAQMAGLEEPEAARCRNCAGQYGWVVRLNHRFGMRPKPFRPSFRNTLPLIPLGFRMWRQSVQFRHEGRIPIMDPLNPRPCNPLHGVPLGGMGGGTIGRGWKGDFNRWQLSPGHYTYDRVAADQFILCVRRDGELLLHQVLYPGRLGKGEALSAWQWHMDGSQCEYRGLYPQAWTSYDFTEIGLRLVCQQISPAIPHDYEQASMPASVFHWTVENLSDHKLEVSITFAFQNGTGERSDARGGHTNRSFSDAESNVHGVFMRHASQTREPYSLCVAARAAEGVEVSRRARFVTSGSGAGVWDELASTGRLVETEADAREERPSAKGETIGCAVAAWATVAAKAEQSFDFSLAWCMPRVVFPLEPEDHTGHFRYFTKFWGRDLEASQKVASHALLSWRQWEAAIDKWQRPVLDDDTLPDWYKSALFNELYVLIDGGTLWLDEPCVRDASGEVLERVLENAYDGEGTPIRLRNNNHGAGGLRDTGVGRFAYLESHEYRMYNTLDVHFYASFALIMLWPKLQLSLMTHFASTLGESDPESVQTLTNGRRAERKRPGSMPHDIGQPGGAPWTKLNSYNIHDTGDWKDLNVKFVLQVYRDYCHTKDSAFLRQMWPVCQGAMVLPVSQDTDGDGLIDNSSFADQTYDAWKVTGASAYCGGLYVAGMRAMVEMAGLVSDRKGHDYYRALYTRAKGAYHDKLWAGSYFRYDSSASGHADSIQADQLCGHLYLAVCQTESYVTPEVAGQVLDTIYTHNVQGFCNGTRGAVNGMRPSGHVDYTSMMSSEVWTGVTYALAATMVKEGKLEEAFATAEGIYRSVYEEFGLGFQTPEAFCAHGDFRAVGYMRPLSIWAMQMALNQRTHTENGTGQPAKPAAQPRPQIGLHPAMRLSSGQELVVASDSEGSEGSSEDDLDYGFAGAEARASLALAQSEGATSSMV